ncbi:MAG: Hpt domain-containing protein [Spirochaetia bacterium]|nr:Hpt domain-containing protein [Spirochaetia bacterium]
MDIVDKEKIVELKELSGGTDDLLKTLLDKYITNTQSFIEQIKKALETKDFEKVLFGVHTIKGSSLSLGLTQLGEKFTDLNLRAKNGNFEGFESEMTSIEKMLKDVITYRATMG